MDKKPIPSFSPSNENFWKSSLEIKSAKPSFRTEFIFFPDSKSFYLIEYPINTGPFLNSDSHLAIQLRQFACQLTGLCIIMFKIILIGRGTYPIYHLRIGELNHPCISCMLVEKVQLWSRCNGVGNIKIFCSSISATI